MKIKLSKGISYKDAELKELDLELGDMTARDILTVESDMRIKGEQVAAWEYSRSFLLNIAARACHLPVEVLQNLNVKDFTRIVNETLNFLAGGVTGN